MTVPEKPLQAGEIVIYDYTDYRRKIYAMRIQAVQKVQAVEGKFVSYAGANMCRVEFVHKGQKFLKTVQCRFVRRKETT